MAEDLVPLLVDCWYQSPHNAMELLVLAATELPLELAHPVVRLVHRGWLEAPTYDPSAGGNADHCYLAALILSDNFDLAPQPWARDVLPKTTYWLSRTKDMPDAEQKHTLMASVHESVSH